MHAVDILLIFSYLIWQLYVRVTDAIWNNRNSPSQSIITLGVQLLRHFLIFWWKNTKNTDTAESKCWYGWVGNDRNRHLTTEIDCRPKITSKYSNCCIICFWKITVNSRMKQLMGASTIKSILFMISPSVLKFDTQVVFFWFFLIVF